MEKNTYDQSIMRTGNCGNRNKSIDIAKGLLILCVVIGHGTQNQSLSDFMYRFHMPLFLILSGCFLKKVEDVETYAKMKATRLNGVYWYITSLMNRRGLTLLQNSFNKEKYVNSLARV